jgi:hypothetical protein
MKPPRVYKCVRCGVRRCAMARAPPRLKLSQKGMRRGGNLALQTKPRNGRVLVSQNLYLLGQFL